MNERAGPVSLTSATFSHSSSQQQMKNQLTGRQLNGSTAQLSPLANIL